MIFNNPCAFVKKAYDKDMKLKMACAYDPMIPGTARHGVMMLRKRECWCALQVNKGLSRQTIT